MRSVSFLSVLVFYHFVHVGIFAADMPRDSEQIIPFLSDVTALTPKNDFIPESGVIEVSELDLMVSFENLEDEAVVRLFDFSEERFFYTIHIGGKVRDIDSLEGMLIIDIQGSGNNERLHYDIIRHAELLYDWQENIIVQLQNMVIYRLENDRSPWVPVGWNDFHYIKGMPPSAKRVLLKVIQKGWVLERTRSCKF